MKKLVIIALVVLGVFYLYDSKLPLKWIGDYLSPSDEIVKSDVIIVVSGSNERVGQGIKLFEAGYAPKLVFSGAAKEGPSNAKTMKNLAVKEGVPETAIILEERATNTLENAKYSKEIVEKQNFDEIILVTSPYHQRRTYEIFKEVFKNEKVKILNSPVEDSSWKADSWWKSEPQAGLTRSEIAKLFWSKLNSGYYQ